MKKILLVGAGSEQIDAIKWAKELGLFVIVVDGDSKAKGFALADKSYTVDISNSNSLIKIAKENNVDGVFCHAVEIPDVIAKVTSALNLPGIPYDVAFRSKHKAERLKCFAKNGVPCAKFRVVKTIPETILASRELGFPCVLKPVDNAGSRGVVKIESEEQIESYFQFAREFSKKEPELLLEEFLEGFEISTESVILNGKVFTTGISDRNYNSKHMSPPFMIEDGGDLPTRLSSSQVADMQVVIEKSLQALGITWGVGKGDLILDKKDNKFKVIEMASRTSGGGFATREVPLANGISIVKVLIKMAVGLPVSEEELLPKFNKGVAQRYLFPRKGIITGVTGLEQIANNAYVKVDEINRDKLIVGNKLPNIRNHTDRLGYVIAVADTREKAIEEAENAIALINIEVD